MKSVQLGNLSLVTIPLDRTKKYYGPFNRRESMGTKPLSIIRIAKINIEVPKNLKSLFLSQLKNLQILITHPIFIFVVLQLVSIAITIMWVVWYTSQIPTIENRSTDIAFFVTGCVLSGIILIGTVMLFVYAIKQSLLNTQQRSFVSSVTHELRSPIASMQLSLETLQSRQLDKELSEKFLGMALSDLNRLVGLVDQILVSARLDRGIKIFEKTESFKAFDLIREVIDSASHLDRDVASRIKIDCHEGLEIVTAKPALALVLGNLIENAIKYSPPHSEIRVSIALTKEHILIQIIDNGIGLEKLEKKKIFKIFQRGVVARKRVIPGTGLGLYIVKSVVVVLGGRVWVESKGINQGSTFYVMIPVKFEDVKK